MGHLARGEDGARFVGDPQAAFPVYPPTPCAHILGSVLGAPQVLAERAQRGCKAVNGGVKVGQSERPGGEDAECGEAVGASAGLPALSGSERTRVCRARA